MKGEYGGEMEKARNTGKELGTKKIRERGSGKENKKGKNRIKG